MSFSSPWFDGHQNRLSFSLSPPAFSPSPPSPLTGVPALQDHRRVEEVAADRATRCVVEGREQRRERRRWQMSSCCRRRRRCSASAVAAAAASRELAPAPGGRGDVRVHPSRLESEREREARMCAKEERKRKERKKNEKSNPLRSLSLSLARSFVFFHAPFPSLLLQDAARRRRRGPRHRLLRRGPADGAAGAGGERPFGSQEREREKERKRERKRKEREEVGLKERGRGGNARPTFFSSSPRSPLSYKSVLLSDNSLSLSVCLRRDEGILVLQLEFF